MAIDGEQVLAFERRFGPTLDQVRVSANKRSSNDSGVSMDSVDLIAVDAEWVGTRGRRPAESECESSRSWRCEPEKRGFVVGPSKRAVGPRRAPMPQFVARTAGASSAMQPSRDPILPAGCGLMRGTRHRSARRRISMRDLSTAWYGSGIVTARAESGLDQESVTNEAAAPKDTGEGTPLGRVWSRWRLRRP